MSFTFNNIPWIFLFLVDGRSLTHSLCRDLSRVRLYNEIDDRFGETNKPLLTLYDLWYHVEKLTFKSNSIL